MLRYLEVKQELKRLVLRMRTGSKIPSRNFLSRKYQVARNTIDKAIAELEEEGYLFSVKGSGTFISARSPGRTLNVGVMLPSIVGDIYPQFILGVEQYAASANINIILFGNEHSPDRQQSSVQRIIEMEADGCIIIPIIDSELSYDSFLQFRQKEIPFVICSRSIDGLDAPFVGVNSYYGAHIATLHLVEQGCRRISYFSHRKYSVALERYYGYESAMIYSAGKAEKGELILGDYGEEELRKRICRVLTEANPPDGVICFDDTTAASLYVVLQEMQLLPGRDVKIVGSNDSDICTRLFVPLSSVSSRAAEMGEEALRILMDQIDHKGGETPLRLL